MLNVSACNLVSGLRSIVYVACFPGAAVGQVSECLQCFSELLPRFSSTLLSACHRPSLVNKVSLWKKCGEIVKDNETDVYKAGTFLFLFPITELNVRSWVKFTD